MAERATVHASTRIVTTPPPAEIEWRAANPDGDRHAFPRREGFPPPAVCGIRWSVLFGHQGARWCEDCLTTIREQLRVLTAALAIAEAGDQGGDHFAGMTR